MVCDKTGLKENEYTGLPTLIVEVISPSNQSHDRIRKYNTYMDFEVKEYWMVNPKLKTVEVYALEDDEYKQAAIYKDSDCAASQIFHGLKIHLEDVFSKD